MLNVVSVENALKIISDNFSESGICEAVELYNAYGRVVSSDIISRSDVPSFSRSTMDGYALKAEDTFGAGDSVPSVLEIKGEILMGQKAEKEIKNGECIKISTGGMLPPGADAVLPVEVTEEENGEICLCYKSVSPLENVTSKGDDVKNGQIVIGKGTELNFTHIGVLAAMGISTVSVKKRPLVGIISTGDELTAITAEEQTGKVRDVNSFLLSAMCEKYGAQVKRYGIVKDERALLLSAIKKASEECDAVLVSGGSSAGARDMTADIINELGTVFAHGIAMKPGKPTIIGKIGEKAVFGLPGHPAACCFVTEVLVKKYIDICLGRNKNIAVNKYILSENISSNHGREEYICVKTDGDTAFPVYAKSGVISLLSSCDGYIRIERDSEGLKKGEEVSVFSF